MHGTDEEKSKFWYRSLPGTGATYETRKDIIKYKNRIIEYDLSPTQCKQCNTPLKYDQRHNTFCSRSCSAVFNNLNSPSDRKRGPTAKSKPPSEPKSPYSKLYRCKCNHCGFEWLNRTQHSVKTTQNYIATQVGHNIGLHLEYPIIQISLMVILLKNMVCVVRKIRLV